MATRPIALACLVLAALLLGAPAIPGASAKKRGPQMTWRYPVKGDHSYGNLQNTRFGVSRPDGSKHKGQDIIANCGQPLIAAHKARVQKRGYGDGIGYYVVLDGIGTRFSFVYDHMKGPGGPARGHVVKPGRRIGYVGATEVSTGICHLHFEMWKGRWPHGRRVDPLSRLRKWEKFSKGRLVDDKDLSAASKAVAASEAGLGAAGYAAPLTKDEYAMEATRIDGQAELIVSKRYYPLADGDPPPRKACARAIRRLPGRLAKPLGAAMRIEPPPEIAAVHDRIISAGSRVLRQIDKPAKPLAKGKIDCAEAAGRVEDRYSASPLAALEQELYDRGYLLGGY